MRLERLHVTGVGRLVPVARSSAIAMTLRQALAAFGRWLVKAVSTHYMALLGAAAVRSVVLSQQRGPDSGRLNLRPPPSGFMVADARTSAGANSSGWWSVRDSNPRLPDFGSGALPTELTAIDAIRFRAHTRNTPRQPQPHSTAWGRCAAGRTASTDLA